MNKPSVDSSTFSIIRLIRPQHGGKLNASFDMLIQLQAHQSQPQIKDKNPFQSVTRMQLLYAIVATSVVWHVALHWIYKYIDLPPPFRHSIIQSLQSTDTCCPSNRKKNKIYTFFKSIVHQCHLEHHGHTCCMFMGQFFIVFWRRILGTYHCVKRRAQRDFQSFVYPAAGGQFHCHSVPAFSGDAIWRNSASTEKRKKKQDLDLSTTRTREPFANKSQWIATQLVRFRGHKSLGGCHLLVPWPVQTVSSPLESSILASFAAFLSTRPSS